MLTFGSLFSGIGGMDLGLERAGMTCKWQVEIDDYATRVLNKHWPDVPKFRDVRECGSHNLTAVDLIAGGFPCQDVSDAGLRAGIQDGNRSGLWFEFYRIICELRPRYVLVENVPGLLRNGMGVVLGNLAASGYDAEWCVYEAAEFGLPHKRQRVFIFAYATSERRNVLHDIPPHVLRRDGISNYQPTGYKWQRHNEGHSLERVGWSIEPGICGSNDGIPHRMDRLRGLGNAVVPPVAEFIGRRIMEVEQETPTP